MKSAEMGLRDRYGFLFWLRWILWFAGSFVLAALFWTHLMKFIFGAIAGTELTLTWIVCVFGSWFILVIPFMRKKEQIWKRLNTDQERAVDAWLLGMGVFIGGLAASALGWSFLFKGARWAKAVFGTWLAILIPFLILMYRKADQIFQSAASRQTYEPNYRRFYVDPARRLLPRSLFSHLSSIKPVLPGGGHLVNFRLKDGRRINYVFVLNGNEITGIYDHDQFDFEVSEIEDLEIVSSENLPDFKEERWLRLDLNT